MWIINAAGGLSGWLYNQIPFYKQANGWAIHFNYKNCGYAILKSILGLMSI